MSRSGCAAAPCTWATRSAMERPRLAGAETRASTLGARAGAEASRRTGDRPMGDAANPQRIRTRNPRSRNDRVSLSILTSRVGRKPTKEGGKRGGAHGRAAAPETVPCGVAVAADEGVACDQPMLLTLYMFPKEVE